MAESVHAAALPQSLARTRPAAIALAALGVVYGDIGTSTLYGLKQAVDASGAVTVADSDRCGVGDPLVADPHRRAEVCHPDTARR